MKPDRSKDITAQYRQALDQGKAFAAYRLPGTHTVQCMTGHLSQTLREGESAFTLSFFDPRQKPCYIVDRSPERSSPISIFYRRTRSTSEAAYIKLVKKIIAAIQSGDFKKIVAARMLAIDKPASFNPVAFFEKLCIRYENAFISMSYIPSVGLWIGASPEVLVSETAKTLTTYSLAGTKTLDDTTDWSEKEIEEQKIVTDFIHQKLKRIVPEKIAIKGPMTHEAGSIKHLLSVFTIRHQGKSIWPRVVKSLHPTPAVGGMPQAKAIAFIKREESFDRRFYAGYVGPVNQNGKTNLYVNLRCLEVRDTQIIFYAGCGVTADSQPAREWQESERKIDILKSLI